MSNQISTPMTATQHRRSERKLLVSVVALAIVMIVAALAQRNHWAADLFSVEAESSRSSVDERTRPVFGGRPEPSATPPAVTNRAEIVEPVAAAEEQPSEQRRNVPADVLGFLENWRATMAKGDLQRHVNAYAPQVDRFFTKRGVSRSAIHAEKQRFLEMYPNVNKYEIHDVKLEWGNEGRAVVTFRKDWDTSGVTRFAGSERQRLTLSKAGGEWKITGEEELRVYWVRRG